MNNLSFNKNSFTKSTPATLSKPIINDPNHLSGIKIEKIKKDMHLMNSPKVEEKQPEFKDLQKNNHSKLDSLNAFRNWNKQ